MKYSFVAPLILSNLSLIRDQTSLSLLIKLSGFNYGCMILFNGLTQLTFTCSKSTVETLDKGVKYV